MYNQTHITYVKQMKNYQANASSLEGYVKGQNQINFEGKILNLTARYEDGPIVKGWFYGNAENYNIVYIRNY